METESSDPQVDQRTIRISCKGSRVLPWDDLHPFQGNLKDLSLENFERLKHEILTEGFTDPINAWYDPDQERWFILDGHQRLRVVQILVEEEGYFCPPLPIAEVLADSYDNAKKKLLGLASQYGNVTSQGLFEFAQEAEIELEELHRRYSFPEIDMSDYAAEHYVDIPAHLKKDQWSSDLDKMKNVDEDGSSRVAIIKVVCENDEKVFIKGRIIEALEGTGAKVE